MTMGITMLLMGIAAFRNFAPFSALVVDDLGSLSFLGTIWAYLLPALLIFGGSMLAIGRYASVAAITGGIAFGSVPVGLMLKNTFGGAPLPDVAAAAYPAIIWLVAFYLASNPFPDIEPEVVSEDEVIV